MMTEALPSPNKLTDLASISLMVDRLLADLGDSVVARASSLKRIVFERGAGKYRDQVGRIDFDKDGVHSSSHDDFAPNPDEAAAIKAEWKSYKWPTYSPRLFTGRDQPRADPSIPWSMADPSNIAVCWDAKRQHILCVEERRPVDDGRKDIWIWTHWDDGKWRVAEPPERLPLFGLETIRNAGTVLVHEGPKAARSVQSLVADDGPNGWRSHPWGRELRGEQVGAVAHVAWLGGAKRPWSTDWSPLAKATARIVVVCDHDAPGHDAVSIISRRIGREMWMIQFDDHFDAGFDLADSLPPALFREANDVA